MDSEKDFIDKLYSGKFETFEFQSSEDEWNALNSKLRKSNFLKFSFATFNIYYVVIMIILSCITFYFSISSINKSRKIQNPENKIKVLIEKENKTEIPLVIDSAKIDKCNNKKGINKKTKIVNEVKKFETHQNSNENKVNSDPISPDINSIKDSIQVKPDSSSILKANTQKIKRVKKTVFIKKDNVFVTDTVIVKKKVK